MECADFQCASDLKDKFNNFSFRTMNCVSQERCSGTHRHTVFITLLFASAYLCKGMFTGMKHVKCMKRSRITERHLEICFALVIRPLSLIL